MDSLDKIHELMTMRTGLQIMAGGSDSASVKTPYIEYAMILEHKYRPHQQLKETMESSGEFMTEYQNPSMTDYQYFVVYKSKELAAAQAAIRKLFKVLGTENFILDVKRIDAVGITTLSGIREIVIKRSNFNEVRYGFDLRYIWNDTLIEIEEGAIESAEVTQDFSNLEEL